MEAEGRLTLEQILKSYPLKQVEFATANDGKNIALVSIDDQGRIRYVQPGTTRRIPAAPVEQA